MTNHPDGTYAEFVKKQQASEEDVEEGDANEDAADPNASAKAEESSKTGLKRTSTLKSKKSIKRDPKED